MGWGLSEATYGLPFGGPYRDVRVRPAPSRRRRRSEVTWSSHTRLFVFKCPYNSHLVGTMDNVSGPVVWQNAHDRNHSLVLESGRTISFPPFAVGERGTGRQTSPSPPVRATQGRRPSGREEETIGETSTRLVERIVNNWGRRSGKDGGWGGEGVQRGLSRRVLSVLSRGCRRGR